MKNRSIICAILLSIGVYANAQQFNPANPSNIIPPTPEQAALGKYIDIPVGYATGTTDLSIPLYNVKSGSLSLPLSISYHTGGIKVEEVATWTGLGWSLQAGGSVTRIVRGQPDDFNSDGYMRTSLKLSTVMALPVDDNVRKAALQSANAGDYDVEPDMFMFNCMGYSGKFYYNQDSARFIVVPYQQLRIAYDTNSGGQIKAFRLTMPNGIKCYFGISQDGMRNGWDTHAGQITTTVNNETQSVASASPSQGIIGWQLMDAVAPTGKSIRFSYTTISAIDFGRGGESRNFKAGSGCESADNAIHGSYYVQSTTKAQLRQIITDQAVVDFVTATQNREDIIGEGYSLDSIVIRNKAGKCIKAFRLHYRYLTSADEIQLPGQTTAIALAARKRLMLQKLEQAGLEGIPSVWHQFYYDTTHLLPSRNATSQDFWGYYNGKSNGNYLIPRILTRAATGQINDAGYTAGADRTVDLQYAKAMSLQKVVYPTGGSTEYYYENHITTAVGANIWNGYQFTGLTDRLYHFSPSPGLKVSSAPELYVDSFTVSNIVGDVYLTPSVAGGCGQLCTQITITGISDPSFTRTVQISEGNYYLQVPNGRYRIEALVTLGGLEDPEPTFSIGLSWQENPDPLNIIVGGLRIRKVINRDGLGNMLARTLVYKMFTDTSASSGQLISLPAHTYMTYCGFGNEIAPSVGMLTASPTLPLSNSDGRQVRYTQVTEYYQDQAKGYKTEYVFSFDNYNQVDPNSPQYPYPKDNPREWRTGLLLNKKQYELTAQSVYRPLTEERHYYKSFDVNLHQHVGVGIAGYPYPGTFGYTSYKMVNEWYLEDSTVQYQYVYLHPLSTSPESVARDLISYTYNKNYFLQNTRTLNSKNQVVDSKQWYAGDYTAASAAFISDLQEGFMVQLPVRKEMSQDGKLVSGELITYQSNGLPISWYRYSNRSLADTQTFSPVFVVPSNYELRTTIQYDSTGNPVETATDGAVQSYLWDYGREQVIASVTNAAEAAIAYTSFESNGKGNWQFADEAIVAGESVTGNRAYRLSDGNIQRTGLQAGTTYWLSYWRKDGSGTVSIGGSSMVTINGWTLYQLQVTGSTSVTISGTAIIDELRMHPVGAQMTTYTYDPLIGLTSQADASHKIMYYEYDGLGRLMLIRDQYRNILKRFEYQYQQNP